MLFSRVFLCRVLLFVISLLRFCLIRLRFWFCCSLLRMRCIIILRVKVVLRMMCIVLRLLR